MCILAYPSLSHYVTCTSTEDVTSVIPGLQRMSHGHILVTVGVSWVTHDLQRMSRGHTWVTVDVTWVILCFTENVKWTYMGYRG